MAIKTHFSAQMQQHVKSLIIIIMESLLIINYINHLRGQQLCLIVNDCIIFTHYKFISCKIIFVGQL
jgi:hypothetical protein